MSGLIAVQMLIAGKVGHAGILAAAAYQGEAAFQKVTGIKRSKLVIDKNERNTHVCFTLLRCSPPCTARPSAMLAPHSLNLASQLSMLSLQHGSCFGRSMFGKHCLLELAQVHIAWLDDGTAVFAFRGTATMQDSLADVKVMRLDVHFLKELFPGARAHLGGPPCILTSAVFVQFCAQPDLVSYPSYLATMGSCLCVCRRFSLHNASIYEPAEISYFGHLQTAVGRDAVLGTCNLL